MLVLELSFVVGCRSKTPRPAPLCDGAAPSGLAEQGRQVIQAAHASDVTHVAFGPEGLLASTDGATVNVWLFEQRRLVHTFRTVEVTTGLAWAGPGRLALELTHPQSYKRRTVDHDLHGRELEERPSEWRIIDAQHGGELWHLTATDETATLQRSTEPARQVTAPSGVLAQTGLIGDEWATKRPPIALSTDGLVLAAAVWRQGTPAGDVSDIHVWRFEDARTDHQVFEFAGTVDGLELTRDGSHARIELAETNRLFDTRSGVETAPEQRAKPDTATVQTVLSPDGRVAVSVLDEHLPPRNGVYRSVRRIEAHAANDQADLLWLWTDTGGPEAGFNDYVESAFFTPDGASVLAALADGSIAVLDARDGHLEGRFGAAVDATVAVAAVDPHRLLIAHEHQLIEWDLSTMTPMATALGRSYADAQLGAALDSTQTLGAMGLAVVGDKVMAANLEVADGAFQLAVGTMDEFAWPQPASSADAQSWLATSSWPPPVDRGGLWTLPLLSVDDISLRHGLAIGSTAQGCAIVDLRAPAATELEGIEWGCIDWALAANARLDLVAGHFIARANIERDDELDDTIWLGMWDTRGKLLITTELPANGNRCGGGWHFNESVALATDQTTLAVACGRELFTIDVASGLVETTDVTESIASIAWTPGGDLLVARGDGAIERRRGDTVEVGQGPGGGDKIAAMSPDGAWFGTIGDGVVRVWNTSPLSLRTTLIGFRDQEYMAYTPDGYYAGTPDVGERVAWVFDDPVEAFSFDQYAADFVRPDVIAARIAGGTQVSGGVAKRPPQITLELLGATGATARVRVHARSSGRVDLVRLFLDGKPTAAGSICVAEGTLDLDVPLHGGLNRVTGVAYAADGLASRWASADVVGPERTSPPKIWVVAVGVSHYPALDEDQQLEAADDDARAIADAFRAQAKQGAFGASDVSLLIDEDATAERILTALRRLDEMAPDDLAVVFFAGHGVKSEDRGEMTFLTTEATPARLDEGLEWAEVATALGRARGRVVVLLDACHSGHFSRDIVVPSDALSEAFAAEGRAGALVFSAAKGRQLSYEPTAERAIRSRKKHARLPVREPARSGVSHGLFTAALLVALDDPATDRDLDGDIETSEWIDAVTEAVGRQTHGLQTPSVSRREIQGEIRIGKAAK